MKPSIIRLLYYPLFLLLQITVLLSCDSDKTHGTSKPCDVIDVFRTIAVAPHEGKPDFDALYMRYQNGEFNKCPASLRDIIEAWKYAFQDDYLNSIRYGNRALAKAIKEHSVNRQLLAYQILTYNDSEMHFNSRVKSGIEEIQRLIPHADKPYRDMFITYLYLMMADSNVQNLHFSEVMSFIDKAEKSAKRWDSYPRLRYRFQFLRDDCYYNHGMNAQSYSADSLALAYLDEQGFDSICVERLQVHARYARICPHLNRMAEAEMHYDQAVAILKHFPEMTFIYAMLSDYLDAAHRYEEQEKMLRSIPYSAKAYGLELNFQYALTKCLLRQGKASEAQDCFARYVWLINHMKTQNSDYALEEMNVAYDTAELKVSNANKRMYIIAGSVFILMLIIVIVMMIIYQRRLKNMYRIALHRIDEFMSEQGGHVAFNHVELVCEEEEEPAEVVPQDMVSPEIKEEFNNIDALMKAEKPYLDKNFNADSLHEFLQMDRRRVNDILRQTVGKTSAKYIVSLRMERAIMLLKEQPGYTVEAIAEESGFASGRTFSRLFSDVFGISPASYRNSLK